MNDNCTRTLEGLLAERPADARRRARDAFDRSASPGLDLVLFGAGNLGRKTLSGLRRHGIEPRAFADNNPLLWRRRIDDVEVLEPAEAARRFGRQAVFVITIWGAGSTHRQAQTRRQLEALDCKAIASFGHLFWKFPETFLPHYALDLPEQVVQAADEILAALPLLADEASRQEYVAQVRFRLELDFDGLPHPVAGEPYFREELFALGDDEMIVDCGAFDGDTLRTFLALREDRFRGAAALEPDPGNFESLERYVAALAPRIRERIALHRVAAWSACSTLRFAAGAGMSSRAGPGGACEVRAETLDGLLLTHRPTLIKMDIEGAELEALVGARRVVRENRPVLAVSAYHRQDHLWKVPLLAHTLADDYALYLRPHGEEVYDLVCYAVPRERLRAAAS